MEIKGKYSLWRHHIPQPLIQPALARRDHDTFLPQPRQRNARLAGVAA